MIAISSCLLGLDCRYDGGDNLIEDIKILAQTYGVIPICPEQMGGLETPREPAEIISRQPLKVISKVGTDVTKAFVKGAEEAVKLAKDYKIEYAVLKAKSPSCGSINVYNGCFEGRLIAGRGITADYFEKQGIRVFNENNFQELLEILEVSHG